MGISLADLVICSEKKRNLLLLLKDRPCRIEEIKSLLFLSSTSALSHARALKNAGLLVEEKGVYRLSERASLIVEIMKELLETLDFLEINMDYWKKHDLTPIPSFLLSSINKLGSCKLLEPDAVHMVEIPQPFRENILQSKRILTFLSYFHPAAPSLYAGLAEKDVDLSLCMTGPVFERFSRDFPAEVEIILTSKNSKIFLCRQNAALPEVVATDRFMALRLSEGNKLLRNQLMMSLDEKALQWGRDLYGHYEKMSQEIKGAPIDW